jgi:hypothetical protein
MSPQQERRATSPQATPSRLTHLMPYQVLLLGCASQRRAPGRGTGCAA